MKYVCKVCGYVYDEEKEKVPFDQLPEDWQCPLCKAPKSSFAPEAGGTEVSSSTAAAVKVSNTDTVGDTKLSVGQLAALCSNLARGCDKQYLTEESEGFAQLADYLTSIAAPVADATVEKIEKALSADIESYSAAKQVANDEADRGAARALTWGEKVSRMLQALVERYLKEGEGMLDGQDIWLCTACGFVYVGEEAPQLCPVCKVPSWKFEKIEGRA